MNAAFFFYLGAIMVMLFIIAALIYWIMSRMEDRLSESAYRHLRPRWEDDRIAGVRTDRVYRIKRHR